MNNKSIYIIVAFIVFLSSITIGVKLLEKKIVKSVMLELKRDYVPGPFSPGYDPDKIDPIAPTPNEELEKIEEEALKSFNGTWN